MVKYKIKVVIITTIICLNNMLFLKSVFSLCPKLNISFSKKTQFYNQQMLLIIIILSNYEIDFCFYIVNYQSKCAWFF